MSSRELKLRPGALQAPQLDYILVDGSGSMQDKWWNCLAALDGFIDVMKTRNIHSHGIVSVFSGNDLGTIQRDGLLRDWKPFNVDPIGSNWLGTPLYDAINNMCRILRDMDPPNCSIVIVTDGDDLGGSRHTTVEQARALLDWARAKGWQVTFIGCDFDNNEQAKLLGATAQNSLGVRKELMKDAGRLLGERRAANAQDADTDINFTEDERTKFGGYLSAPKGE
jgi:hypothetical protein